MARKFVRAGLIFVLSALIWGAFAGAQQTLGGISGIVTDVSGAAIRDVQVTATAEATTLRRETRSNAQGSYTLNDLPIGTYMLSFTHQGFSSKHYPAVVVQADRTTTLPVHLSVGAVSESVTVNLNPLLNAVDTTNGYVLDRQQIESVPQPTGSFTGLAILAPGVSAELPPGTGSNEGLGNLPIWANGQRDTSNSFSLNGVDATNLFNGKSTSSVGSARIINDTGAPTSIAAGGVIPSSASIYLSIGQAIPTPAPEMVEEIQVNASMYDAQQGATSGAHIALSTVSGTNQLHGSLYGRRETNWLNAAPFFFKNDADIPENLKNPELHRYVLGGTVGGPIVRNKLFGFLAYQHLQVSDQEIGDSFLNVPVGLSDSTRTAAGFAGILNAQFGTHLAATDIDRTALALFNSPALPGEPGKWLIPNDTASASLSPTHPFDAFLPGTARFKADMAVADLDYNATAKDTLALKYYFQHDPTLAPYAYSSVPGFAEHLDAGAQVFSINNTLLLKPTLSTQQSLGFAREKIYATNEQPFGPNAIPGGSFGTVSINTFGSSYFPGVSIVNVLGAAARNAGVGAGILNVGPNAFSQASNTGVFQNRLQPAASAIWTLGRHTVSFGANYSYTQLNTIDHRTGTGTIASDDASQYAQGFVTPGSTSTLFYVSTFLQGNANRYFRANQLGAYVQDKFQLLPNLSLTAGVRYDWDGGLTEKYGRIFNFEPSLYSYSDATDTINNPGLIIAGNNPNGTPGVSPTTLTGRQWGLAPRLGVAWQPQRFRNTLVVRSGFGMYYDRGELFSYFSPGYAIGTVTGGPFGANQQLPFVTAQNCPKSTQYLYLGYIATCGGTAASGNLANPYGNVESPAPTNPKSSDLSNYLPNASAIVNNFGQPISLGVYDRRNNLPYTFNYTLDLQWQPCNDLALEVGYVGNVGRHQIIPVPFNQPGIASPTHPIHGQNYSYGYTVVDSHFKPINLPNGQPYLETYEGGNVDLRVPYIGYAAESIDYRAAGVDAYNALTAHLEKRMSHGLQLAASYTYSHALDEHSGMGLFYNGNNPLNLRDAYASADFDRTHVLTFNYTYKLPDLAHSNKLASLLANGWSIVGLTVLQSGQPYSVIDFTGAVGSVFYSTNDGITNPIVPLAPGCTAKNARTGHSGAFGATDAALKASCFTLPLLAPGAYNGAIPSNDPYETGFTTGQRNIFRQAFQKRADASIINSTKLTDRYTLRYTFDIYNLTNTPSFDVPFNEVAQNQYFNNVPQQGTPVSSFYNAPFGLGVVTHTIGSPRQIQMSLTLSF